MTCKRKPENIAKAQQMQEAIEALKSGCSNSIYAAADKFNIPYSTLKHRVNGCVSQEESHESYQSLFPASEAELARWIMQPTIAGYSPSHRTVYEMAELIRERQSGINSNTAPLVPLSQDWVYNFLQ